ncbi:MAG: DEAD/DEAH box helicase, partial [Clostridia bacterium]|nr:DEAD/DEAH box helicase [Clostridia bacterium]
MEQTSFETLPLSPEILRAVGDLNFMEMTQIQEKAIPKMLEGCDLIGRSSTGTGKTAAFGLPAIDSIDPSADGVQVLVMLPTRELALQVCEELRKFSKYKEGVRVVPVYGGANIATQITQLKGAKIVVGTPGRIKDHLSRRTLKLGTVRLVVLDEADEMLNMG